MVVKNQKTGEERNTALRLSQRCLRWDTALHHDCEWCIGILFFTVLNYYRPVQENVQICLRLLLLLSASVRRRRHCLEQDSSSAPDSKGLEQYCTSLTSPMCKMDSFVDAKTSYATSLQCVWYSRNYQVQAVQLSGRKGLDGNQRSMENLS